MRKLPAGSGWSAWPSSRSGWWLKLPNPTSAAWVISVMVDHVLGSVMYPVMPRGWWAATTEFKVNLLAPVTGEVVEINEDVNSDPALINSDPYGAGWLFKVAVTEEGPLMSGEEYAAANGGEL